MGTEKDHARGTRQESWKASSAFNWQSNLAVKSTPDQGLVQSKVEPKGNWLSDRQRNPEEQSKTFRPISVKVGSLDAMEAYVSAMREPAPIDEANLKLKEEKTPKEPTGEKSKASPVLVASANLTSGQIRTEEQKGAQSPQLLAQVTAPPRVPPPPPEVEVPPPEVLPGIRTPFEKIPGTQTTQPGVGPAPLSVPAQPAQTDDQMTNMVNAINFGNATLTSISKSFGNRLPSAALRMPPDFLQIVLQEWNQSAPQVIYQTGGPVPQRDPPSPHEMLQLWNNAWRYVDKDKVTPEMAQTYQQVSQQLKQADPASWKTLQDAGLAQNTPGVRVPHSPAVPPPGAAAGAAAAAIAGARTPAPAPQTGPDVQQILGNVQQSRITHNAEAGNLMDAQKADREAREAGQKADAKARTAALTAKHAQRRKNQQQHAKKSEQTNRQKLTEIQKTKQAMYQRLQQSLLDMRLEKVPPEQQAGVLRRAAQRYRNQTGRVYNLKNPKDPNNDPRELLEYVNEDLAQGGGAAVPPVTKPEPLPKKSGNGPDKKIPTLPLQTKRDTTKQGGFVPQPLPEVRPTTEGEQAKEDQAQSVTSKATEPSEPEPPTAKKGQPKGQKRAKPTAASVKKAMSATRKWGTDYRANYKRANGSIPAGHQIHHLTPRAVYSQSKLAQDWTRRGITGLNDPENLEALPQTKEAYDKSDIKIQHSGSHGKWSKHAEEVLDQAKTKLEGKYGSLDKVPDDVMTQTKDDVMQQLREDLLDKDLGIEKGWIQNTDNGMDKLSQSQPSAQLG